MALVALIGHINGCFPRISTRRFKLPAVLEPPPFSNSHASRDAIPWESNALGMELRLFTNPGNAPTRFCRVLTTAAGSFFWGRRAGKRAEDRDASGRQSQDGRNAPEPARRSAVPNRTMRPKSHFLCSVAGRFALRHGLPDLRPSASSRGDTARPLRQRFMICL
jgi:hypothetical protein